MMILQRSVLLSPLNCTGGWIDVYRMGWCEKMPPSLNQYSPPWLPSSGRTRTLLACFFFQPLASSSLLSIWMVWTLRVSSDPLRWREEGVESSLLQLSMDETFFWRNLKSKQLCISSYLTKLLLWVGWAGVGCLVIAGSLLLIFLAKEGRVGSEGWLSLVRGSPCYALSLFILRILYYYGFILGFLFFEGSSADGYLLVSGRSGSMATLFVLPSKIASLSISCSTPHPQISSSFLCIFLFILLQLNRQQTISGVVPACPSPPQVEFFEYSLHYGLELSEGHCVLPLLLDHFLYLGESLLAGLLDADAPAGLSQLLRHLFACELLPALSHHPTTTNYYYHYQIAIIATIALLQCSPYHSNCPILIILMSKNDNNLLDFLKKNSLFSTPNKNSQRKSRSRSKDKVLQNRLTPNFNQQPYQDPYNHRPFPEPNPNPNQTFVPLQTQNMRVSTRLNDSRFGSFDDLQQKKQGRGVNQVWAGLVSYSTSFESARIESAQCLQSLSSKVRNEISSINIKIENFNSRMYRVITDEFKSLRERLLFVIEESFKEGEKYIREYMKAQEEKLGGELTKVREVLQKEYTKIEGMKEELAKPTWRKTAGDIISNHLEESVEELVKKSSALNIGKWELGDLIGYRLKDLERDLRAAVRLKRDA